MRSFERAQQSVKRRSNVADAVIAQRPQVSLEVVSFFTRDVNCRHTRVWVSVDANVHVFLQMCENAGA
jgi:hypothetical protein